MKTFPRHLRPEEYGVLLRTIAMLVMAKARERHDPLMWAHAVLWFEIARHVDPEGRR